MGSSVREVSLIPSVACWRGPLCPSRSLLTPMPPAARSGPVELGVESRMSVSCSCPLMRGRYPTSGRRLLVARGVLLGTALRLGGLGLGVLALLEDALQRVGSLLDGRVGLGPEVGRDDLFLLGQRVHPAGVRLAGLDLRLRHRAELTGLGRCFLTHRSLLVAIRRSCTAPPRPR